MTKLITTLNTKTTGRIGREEKENTDAHPERKKF